jgi:hypothetical protein
MAEIVGVILGAIMTIGKIIYDECRKIGEQATSCGGHRHHDSEDDTPVPDDSEPPEYKVTLGRNTIRQLLKKLTKD